MLTLSSDRKTTPMANKSGKTALVKNAFGLLSGSDNSCPGATDTCETVCYAGKLEKMYPNVRKAMTSNYEALSGMTRIEMIDALSEVVATFVADCDKRNADKIFRIHHDGDFFSIDYAAAWANVMQQFPSVQFWAYTRTFYPALDVVPVLINIPNLTLLLSVDKDNLPHARKYFDTPGLRMAFLGKTFDDALAMRRNKSVAKCPELTKALPLISEKGGACAVCRLCVSGDKADVAFSSSKK